MNFLGNLGIDLNLLVAQIINFGILLWILNKFVYKSILKKIEKDEEDLNMAREERKKLEEEKQQFNQQKDKELNEAHQKSEQVINEAVELSKRIREKAKEETNREKEAVIKQIKERLDKVDHA